MKTLISVLALATAAAAQTCSVNVRITNPSAAPPAALFQAKSIAADMFARIRVALQWQGSTPSSCWPPIEIRLETGNPPADRPDSLAYSMPYLADAAAIHVFVGRVASMVPAARLGTLLAHVLAHEITHVLQGVSRHSGEGIMKAHWDAADFRAMESHPLPFDSMDVLLIRAAGQSAPALAVTVPAAGANL